LYISKYINRAGRYIPAESEDNMSKITEVRNEVRKKAIEVGLNNILCGHITEIAETCGCKCTDVQNALSYFNYSPQQKAFREKSTYF